MGPAIGTPPTTTTPSPTRSPNNIVSHRRDFAELEYTVTLEAPMHASAAVPMPILTMPTALGHGASGQEDEYIGRPEDRVAVLMRGGTPTSISTYGATPTFYTPTSTNGPSPTFYTPTETPERMQEECDASPPPTLSGCSEHVSAEMLVQPVPGKLADDVDGKGNFSFRGRSGSSRRMARQSQEALANIQGVFAEAVDKLWHLNPDGRRQHCDGEGSSTGDGGAGVVLKSKV